MSELDTVSVRKRKKRSKHEIQSVLFKILDLMMQGREDKVIMKQLGLTKPTFYRYKRRVTKEANETFQKQRSNHIALHTEILLEQLGKLYRAAMVLVESEPNNPSINFHKALEAAKEIGSISVAQSGKLEDMHWAFSSP